MTFMMKTALVGSSQLRNAYTSVLSAAGSSAMSGASRWLAARATETGAVSVSAARSAASPRMERPSLNCFTVFSFLGCAVGRARGVDLLASPVLFYARRAADGFRQATFLG